MKTLIKNLFLLPVLVAGLGLMLFGRATAQTFSFGPQIQSSPSVSITYNSASNSFQYTGPADSTDDHAYLTLTGTAAAFITTTNGWTASLAANLSARSLTSTLSLTPLAGIGIAVIYNNSAKTGVSILLSQANNAGQSVSSDVPSDYYGALVKFTSETNGVHLTTTPLGSSELINTGVSDLLLPGGGYSPSPVTESINAATGVLTLIYDASSDNVTGYYNGSPVGSYPLAGWGGSAPLTLIVIGLSEEGANAPAGTITASNFFAGTLPALAIIHSGTNVILTWPTNATGYTLQSATNLISPAIWTPVSPAPVVVNSNYAVTNAISKTNMFYRLSQ